MIKTTIEIYFDHRFIEFFLPEKYQNRKSIDSANFDEVSEIIENISDEKLLEFALDLEKNWKQILFTNGDRAECSEYIESEFVENVKVIDSDYFGESEGIKLTIQYDFNDYKEAITSL